MMIMLPAIGAAILSSVPSGILSDRVGRKPMIYLSQFLMAVAAAIFVFAPNLTWVYVAGIPAGLAYGVFTAVEWALACNLVPEGEAARYLGVWNASAVVPQILAFPIAGRRRQRHLGHGRRDGLAGGLRDHRHLLHRRRLVPPGSSTRNGRANTGRVRGQPSGLGSQLASSAMNAR